MYLSKSQKNRYTIGKYLRAQKGLRVKDQEAQIIEMPKQLQEYTQELKRKGMQIKGLQYAMFKTSNGLPYPGLIASDKILANTIMLRVPVKCLLTTRVAFFSDIQIVFQENPLFFSKKFTTDWQDHILLAFLLYQSQKQSKSDWYNLIRNLPKDIDYAVFWDKKELELMEDKWMQLGIRQQRQSFQAQTKVFIEICSKYPKLFQPKTYSLENIKWIQSHLVTRCFGKYFEYTTMVPFAELFNHQCVDVYYSMDYKQGNPHTQNQQFYEQKQLSATEMQEMQSSDGSYDADDFYQEDQFFQPFIKDEGKSQNVNSSQLPQFPSAFEQNADISISKDIRSIKSYLLTFINFNDSVSLIFLMAVSTQLERISLTKVTSPEHQQRLKQQLKQLHSFNVKYVKYIKQYYADMKSKYYTYGIKQRKLPLSSIPKQKQTQVKPGVEYFQKEWKQDKFDDFVMLCSTKDQFQKGSQVYFCYGRLPNKLLLLRYGIALPYNKYNHFFLHIDITQEVNKVRPLKNIVEYEINMRKYKRFKLKRTKICVDLMTYLRSCLWKFAQNPQQIFWIKDLKKQLIIIDQAKQIFVEQLSKFSNTLEKNKQNVTNKSLGYHEYFCLIHKIENQQILHWQIKMMDYAKEIFSKMIKSENKISLKDTLLTEKNPGNMTIQIMMQPYFKMVKL